MSGQGVDRSPQERSALRQSEKGNIVSEPVFEKPTYAEISARLAQVLADYDFLCEKWLELNDKLEKLERDERARMAMNPAAAKLVEDLPYRFTQ